MSTPNAENDNLMESNIEGESTSDQASTEATKTPPSKAEKYDLLVQALRQTGGLRNTIPGALERRVEHLSVLDYDEVNIPAGEVQVPADEVPAAWDSIKCEVRDGGDNGPATTFTYFPKLPVEIRGLIWKFATYQPKVLEAFLDYSRCECNYYENELGTSQHLAGQVDDESLPYGFSRECFDSRIAWTSSTHESLAPTSILRTSRESRAQAEKALELIDLPYTDMFLPDTARFNPAQDTIYFGSGCDRYIYQDDQYYLVRGKLDGQRIFEDIQHFAMNLELWQAHITCIHFLTSMPALKTLTIVVRPSSRSRRLLSCYEQPSEPCTLTDILGDPNSFSENDIVGDYLEPDENGQGGNIYNARWQAIEQFIDTWSRLLKDDFSGWEWPNFRDYSSAVDDPRFDMKEEKYIRADWEEVREHLKKVQVKFAIVDRQFVVRNSEDFL